MTSVFWFYCGYAEPATQVSLEDKNELICCIWLHFMLFHLHAELEKLRKGLYQTLQFELLVCTHPNVVWGVLAASTVFNVTPEYLCGVFEVEYSEMGSNNRPKKEAVTFLWFEYVTESADCKDMTVEEILKFVSGSAKIPATGFDTRPRIYFTDADLFPTVSTCEMSITFPRGRSFASFGHMGLELYKHCHIDQCIMMISTLEQACNLAFLKCLATFIHSSAV